MGEVADEKKKQVRRGGPSLPWTLERIRSICEPSEKGCWVWQGAKSGPGAGYGHITVRGKNYRVHRLAYSLAKGAVPEGLMVCHRCNVSACVNPDHLYAGTALDNARDEKALGRHNNGTKTHCAKGHPYSPENTAISVLSKGGSTRKCIQCRKAWDAAAKVKRDAKRLALIEVLKPGGRRDGR